MYCIITSTSRHIKGTPEDRNTGEEYLRNMMAKLNKLLGVNRLNEFIEYYAKLYENKTQMKPVIVFMTPL